MTTDTSMRECPHCKEAIRADAAVCKHCGRSVKPHDPLIGSAMKKESSVVEKVGGLIILGLGVAIILYFVYTLWMSYQ